MIRERAEDAGLDCAVVEAWTAETMSAWEELQMRQREEVATLASD